MPRLAAAVLAVIASAAPAGAQFAPDNPDLLGTCLLLAPLEGTIAPGGDLRSWSTTLPATLTVINTGRARLFVNRPTEWANAPAGAPATAFTSAASLTGVNVGALLGLGDGLSALRGALGTSVVSVSLGATAAVPFPPAPTRLRRR